MNQVHKETLTSVENALGNRSSLDVEIFGMEGIPEDVLQAHNQRIITQFYQAEAERRAATGNPGPGAAAGGQAKKPKFESPAELKKRLAEHKAKMTEQAATGGSSGGNTPGNAQSPALAQSPGAFVSQLSLLTLCNVSLTSALQNGSPFAPPQIPYGNSQGANYGSFSQEPYAPSTVAYQQPYSQQPGYSPPVPQYTPNQPQFPPNQQYPPQQSFPPPGYQQPANFQNGSTPQFGAGSQPGPYNTYQPQISQTPTQHGLPNRPPSLPQAPGLPQRPSFGPPPVSSYPMQQGGPPPQQHGGWGGNGWNGPDHQNSAMSSAYPPHSQGYSSEYGANASSLDDLVSGAAREPDDIDEIIRMAEAGIRPPKKGDAQSVPNPAHISGTIPLPTPSYANEPGQEDAPAPETVPIPESTEKPEATEKKAKKEKDKNTKMIYSDNEVSPEEKMAKMPRYAFVPDGKDETVLVDATQAPAVAGIVDE